MGRRARWAETAVSAAAGIGAGVALGAWWAARRARLRRRGRDARWWPRSAPSAAPPSEGVGDAALKARLLEHLQGGTWVRLGASAVEGVGVIAVRDIPAGTDPFRACNAHLARPEVMVELSQVEVERLPVPVQALVRAFFAPLTDDEDREWRTPEGLLYGVNATGVSTLDSSWYLNHSTEPNVAFRAANLEGGENFNTYVTLRDVREDEELCVDYGEIGQVYLQETLQVADGGDEGRGGWGRSGGGGGGGGAVAVERERAPRPVLPWHPPCGPWPKVP